MHTVWGVFKAVRMSGIDDRGEFYRFWYMAVDLQPGEVPLESWKAMRVPTTRAQQFAVVGGNLILTTHRVLFEPYANNRAAPGVNPVANMMAALQDRISPRAPIAVSLKGLRVEPRDDDKHVLALSTWGGIKSAGRTATIEFYFGGTTVFGRGDANKRDEVLRRLQAA